MTASCGRCRVCQGLVHEKQSESRLSAVASATPQGDISPALGHQTPQKCNLGRQNVLVGGTTWERANESPKIFSLYLQSEDLNGTLNMGATFDWRVLLPQSATHFSAELLLLVTPHGNAVQQRHYNRTSHRSTESSGQRVPIEVPELR